MWVSIFCVRLVAADVVRERCMSIGRATTTTILYTATCATHNDCGTSTLNVRAVREQYRNERTFPPHYPWRCGVWRLYVDGVKPFSDRPRKCSPRWKNVICIFLQSATLSEFLCMIFRTVIFISLWKFSNSAFFCWNWFRIRKAPSGNTPNCPDVWRHMSIALHLADGRWTDEDLKQKTRLFSSKQQ